MCCCQSKCNPFAADSVYAIIAAADFACVRSFEVINTPSFVTDNSTQEPAADPAGVYTMLDTSLSDDTTRNICFGMFPVTVKM